MADDNAELVKSLKEAIAFAIRKPNAQFAYTRCRVCDSAWWERAEHRRDCPVPTWEAAALSRPAADCLYTKADMEAACEIAVAAARFGRQLQDIRDGKGDVGAATPAESVTEAMCTVIQTAVSDYTRRTPAHLRDCDILTGHIIRAVEAAAPQNAAPVPDLEEWSRNVRLTIRGIDGQAERILGPIGTDWKAGDEEIIVGYKLKTGLWHRLLGLLATCPAKEGAMATAEQSKGRSDNEGFLARMLIVCQREFAEMQRNIKEWLWVVPVEIRARFGPMLSAKNYLAAAPRNAALSRPAAPAESVKVLRKPTAYVCPVGCGCLWRDNKDGTMSLFGKNSKSCEVCEFLPLDKLLPLFDSGFALAAISRRGIPELLKRLDCMLLQPDGWHAEDYEQLLEDCRDVMLSAAPPNAALSRPAALVAIERENKMLRDMLEREGINIDGTRQADTELDRILNMTDAEVNADLIRYGIDPAEVIMKSRYAIMKAVELCDWKERALKAEAAVIAPAESVMVSRTELERIAWHEMTWKEARDCARAMLAAAAPQDAAPQGGQTITEPDSQESPAGEPAAAAYSGPSAVELYSWQPIETALHSDGWISRCLFAIKRDHGWEMWVGQRDDWTIWLGRTDTGACFDTEAPTHWMPLSSAPPAASPQNAAPRAPEAVARAMSDQVLPAAAASSGPTEE